MVNLLGLSTPWNIPTVPSSSSSSPSWTAADTTWKTSGMADGYRSQDRASGCPSDSSQSWSGAREVTMEMQGCCYESDCFNLEAEAEAEGSSLSIQLRRHSVVVVRPESGGCRVGFKALPALPSWVITSK